TSSVVNARNASMCWRMAQAVNAIISRALAPKTHTKTTAHTRDTSHLSMADSANAFVPCAFAPNSGTIAVVVASYTCHAAVTDTMDALSVPAFTPHARSACAVPFDSCMRLAHAHNASPVCVRKAEDSVASSVVRAFHSRDGSRS